MQPCKSAQVLIKTKEIALPTAPPVVPPAPFEELVHSSLLESGVSPFESEMGHHPCESFNSRTAVSKTAYRGAVPRSHARVLSSSGLRQLVVSEKSAGSNPVRTAISSSYRCVGERLNPSGCNPEAARPR